jgi:hypothetical protein
VDAVAEIGPDEVEAALAAFAAAAAIVAGWKGRWATPRAATSALC